MAIRTTVTKLAALVAAGLLTYTPGASAGDAFSRKLTHVQIVGTTQARLKVDASVSGRPACHNTQSSYALDFAFDHSTAKGKALLSTATAALLAGRTVTVNGTNACASVDGINIEQVSSLWIVP